LECPECGGKVITEIVPYFYRNRVFLGEFEAEVCIKCGARYFKETSFVEIEKRAKVLRIWGREAKKGLPLPSDFTTTATKSYHVIPAFQLYNPYELKIEEKITVRV